MHVRFSVRIFFRGVLESPYDGYMGRRGANVLLCVSNANAMQSCSDDDKGLTAYIYIYIYIYKPHHFRVLAGFLLLEEGSGLSFERPRRRPQEVHGGNRRPAHPRWPAPPPWGGWSSQRRIADLTSIFFASFVFFLCLLFASQPSVALFVTR